MRVPVMRRLQLFLLLIGIALFVLVVRNVGVSTIVQGLRSVGWSFVGIFAIELLIDALHTEGWRWCLPPHERVVPFFHLLATRTAGFAVNALTPTATVGGEVVKGMLLRRWVPLADAFAAVLVDKLTFAVAQAMFLVVGLVSVLQGIPLNARERTFAVVIVIVWTAAVGAFFALQRYGVFRIGIGVVRGLFGGGSLLERLPERTADFDSRITTYLTGHQRDFARSVLFHLVAQAARTLQFYLALTALGFDPGLFECFATAAGFVFIEATLFLVPGKLGVLEGGHVVIFSALGFGAAAGLTVSFALRLSELCSALLGLVALGYYHLEAGAPESPGGVRP